MKRIIMIMLAGLLFFYTSSVNGETFTNYYPGGKNYIDPQNVDIENTLFRLIDPIKVKPNTEYVFTVPNEELLGVIYNVSIEGVIVYLDNEPSGESSCQRETNTYVCSFTTDEFEDYIDIFVEAGDMLRYVQYYELENFQLEEGIAGTSYEEYIPPYIDAVSPSFSGQGGFITSYKEVTPIQEIIDAHIVAIDEIDGDISDQIMIESDEYTTNEQVIGQYEVLLIVSDSSLNEAQFTLYIIVKDEIAPIIPTDKDIYVDVNTEESLQMILENRIDYYDEYDSNLEMNILSDLYSGYEHLLGEYVVEIEVLDLSGNRTIKQFLIHVMDFEGPRIISSVVLETNVNTTKTINEIVSDISVEDNYDLSPSVTVLSDGYTGNESIIGIYFVEVEVKDFSNNTQTYGIEIEVKDYDNPVIISPSTIGFSYEDILSLDEILDLISVADNYDDLDKEDIVITFDSYSLRTSSIGDYEISFKVTDSSGNSANASIDINIYDDVVPTIFIDEYIVVIDNGSSFSSNDAYLLLVNNKELQSGEYETEILVDDYTGNELIPGEYQYTISFKDKEGVNLVKEFLIKVEDEEVADDNYIRTYIVTGIIIVFPVVVLIKKRK